MKKETRIKLFRGEHSFAAAHFLIDMGKCERLHGHNYMVTVEICGEPGDDDVIIDFHTISPVIKNVCDALDHRFILAEGETRYQIIISETEIEIKFPNKRFVFPREDCVILPVEATTVEKLSAYLADKIVDESVIGNRDIDWIEVGVSEGSAQMALCKRYLR